MSGSGLCWVPDADGNLSSTGRESHVGLLDLSPAGEDSHEGGLETSLQAFQDTCVLFFFFLFTIRVTLVNPSINRQIRLQGDRVWTGRGGRHLCICSAAPGQTTLLPAGMG